VTLQQPERYCKIKCPENSFEFRRDFPLPPSAAVEMTRQITISNPEPAILCGGLLRLWETPANFGRKSLHWDPVLRSTFINRHRRRQTWIMPLFKLITTLILKRTLARVLKCCKILLVVYFNLFNCGQSWIVVLLALRVMPILIF
jgi:hypothetical protein